MKAFSWCHSLIVGAALTIAAHVASASFPGVLAASSESIEQSPARAIPEDDGKYVINLLVLYTTELINNFGELGAFEVELERLLHESNRFFDVSQMPIRYSVTATAPFSDEASLSGPYSQNQTTLAASARVSQLRNEAHADLVVLLRARDEDCAGLSVLFNGGEQTDPPQNVDPERDAYVVVGINSGASAGFEPCEFVFAHELGHALGGGHQRGLPVVRMGGNGTVTTSSYWKPYAAGTACGLSSEGRPFWSIMTSFDPLPCLVVDGACTPNASLFAPRGDFFSDPDVHLDGIACGTEDGVTGGELGSDNARAITEAAPYVAAYRSASNASAYSSSVGSGSMSICLIWLAILAAGSQGVRCRDAQQNVAADI